MLIAQYTPYCCPLLNYTEMVNHEDEILILCQNNIFCGPYAVVLLSVISLIDSMIVLMPGC